MALFWAAYFLLLPMLLSGLLSGPVRAAEPALPPLVLERTIPLPGVSGRIDHLAVDLRRGRLFVAELENGSVGVVDLASGNVIHRITGLKEPQGVGYVPGGDLVAVASGGGGALHLFRGEDFRPAVTVVLGEDPDNVRINARTGHLVVGYGIGPGSSLATVDPVSRSVVGTVGLAAHPESFQLHLDAGRAYVNLPGAGQVAVVDLATSRQVAGWPVPDGLRGHHAMALDAVGSRLAIVFRDPPRLLLLDVGTGATTANLETCGDADDVFLDAKRRRLYVSCGSGEVDTVQQDAAGYLPLARIPSRSGARTSLFVPKLDRLFIVAPTGPLAPDAALLVFRPGP